MKLDLAGQRFGKLTVLREDGKLGKCTAWLCKCDCGKEKRIRTNSLTSGVTKSCGMHQREHLENRKYKYPPDVRIRRLRNIWYGMLKRCNKTNHKEYKYYGGRGITVCENWNDYVVFARWALSNGYSNDLTIDRIDNDGNYEPSNCRWVTIQEQLRNRSNNRHETINGVTKTVAEWSRDYGVEKNTVYRRLDRGMSIVEALTKRSRVRNG